MRGLLILFLVLFVCLPAFAQGWEWLNPLPQGNSLTDIEFLGENRLLCTGDFGSAISSTDGGQSWVLCSNGSQPSPSEVDFVNSSDGWGIRSYYSSFDGSERAIMRTTDGGQAWQLQHSNPHLYLWDLSFPTVQCGWVVASTDTSWNLVILNTSDGGTTWTEQATDSFGFHARVYFRTESEGWIVNDYTLMHTTDGGATWNNGVSPYAFYNGLQFLDSQNGWGAGGSNLCRTANAAQTWIPQSLPDLNNRTVKSFTVLDASHIWAIAGGNRVYRTSDGGQTWMYTQVDSLNYYNKIEFADALQGWICGWGGVVKQTTDGGVTWTQRAGDIVTDGTYGFSAVSFSDLQNGWIAGTRARGGAPILHTTDGGLNWAAQYSDTSNRFTDIEAVSATDIWAVGTTVLHSTDGGQQWNVVDIGTSAYCQQIICLSDQVIWIASGWSPTWVYRSTDGGNTWENHTVEHMADFASMSATDANNVWISSFWCFSCDDVSGITHSSDGGITWTAQLTDGSMVGTFCFADSLHGWATGWPGLIRTSDGGTTWEQIGTEEFWGVTRIQFFDTLNGWATGYGMAARTTDGGNTWDHFDSHADYYGDGMDFVDMSHGWIVGGNKILRFDGTLNEVPPHEAPNPLTCNLYPAYPNPFNSMTTLSFDLSQSGRARIELFDITGRLVQTVSDRVYSAGHHTLRVNASALPSGLYFARASSGALHSVQKLVLLK